MNLKKYYKEDYGLHIKKIDGLFCLFVHDGYTWEVWTWGPYLDVKKTCESLNKKRKFLPRSKTSHSVSTFNDRFEITKQRFKGVEWMTLNNMQALIRALEVGNYNAAPTHLVQGSALQVEDVDMVLQEVIYDNTRINLNRNGSQS